MSQERAVLAGGCFWGMQDLFRRYEGVVSTRVGYTGGEVRNATYRNHGTHAEAIEIIFDPAKLSYRRILEFFFQVHDPSTRNRQGNDTGPSYRSAIFYTNEQQHKAAEAYVKQLDAAHVFDKAIVTQIVPLEAFYRGEEYHQDYAIKNPHNPYIQVCDIPKIGALQQQFPTLFQEYTR